MASFESRIQKALASFRVEDQDGRSEQRVPISYLDNPTNQERALQGDEDGVYTHAIGRAAEEGESEVAVEEGQAQRLLTDLMGRLWTVLFVDGAPVSSVNPLPVTSSGGGIAAQVTGNVANDAVDSGNPVKIGARAAAITGLAPTVAVNDRTDVAADVNGRLITIPQGNVAHDAVDAGNPLKIGARAAATSDGFTAVIANDRVDLASDLNGRQLVIPVGNVANDAVDSGNPVKTGARAVGIVSTAANADVATQDRVDNTATLQGDQWVVQRYAIAGEDISPDVMALAVVRQPISVEQHALEMTSLIPAANTVPALVAKATVGNLYEVFGINDTGANVYVQIHNLTAAPGAVAPLVSSAEVPTGGNFSLSFTDFPIHCGQGIVVALSSTPNVYTALAAGTGYSFTVRWK